MADYTPTEAKYRRGATEMYVTYDLEQDTRGGGTATYPKVKRVYVPGEVDGWEVGDFEKRSGRTAHGVRIRYAQARKGYRAKRGDTEYEVEPSSTHVTKVVEVPEDADNVRFRGAELPRSYRSALQDVS